MTTRKAKATASMSNNEGPGTMAAKEDIKIGVLKRSEVEEGERIFQVGFSKFLGIADPVTFVGDRRFVVPRWKAGGVVRFLWAAGGAAGVLAAGCGAAAADGDDEGV
jgi:hypothetical protein